MEPAPHLVRNVMLGTGMDYIQARNHLKSRALIMEMNKITSGIRQQQQEESAARLTEQVIAKAMRA